MPEYFDISFIVDKKAIKAEELFLNEFNLQKGENLFADSKFSIFKKKKIHFSIYEDEKTNFYEYTVSFPDQVFHRESFNNEIKEFSKFINECFYFDKNILFALCSYELNGYLLEGITDLACIGKEFLMKFPIVFINKNISQNYHNIEELEYALMIVNHDAQDIF